MESENISSVEFVGREKEFEKLKDMIKDIENSKGRMVLISGEAGIGKTRLVSEVLKEAQIKKFKVLSAKCLSDSFEPLFPIKDSLKNSGLEYLIYERPPRVLSAYLINDAGMLLTGVERNENAMDPDIFASMLQAVASFVQDSFSMMGKEGKGLNTLGYGDYRIVIQHSGKMSLAAVIEGKESEFLIEDMNNFLIEIGNVLDSWSGDEESVAPYKMKLEECFIKSGKYDGRYLIDDPKIRQENLFDNILLGLKRISDEIPVILFVDDLQWADPSTLNLLHYLARNTTHDKIGIIGTYRHEDVNQIQNGKVHPLRIWMQNLSREGLFEEIRLNIENTKALIKRMLKNAEFNDEFYSKIYRETEGIPLYILETVKLMVEEGTISFENGIWKIRGRVENLGIPKKIYDVIRRRIDRLSEEDREIMEVASVVGEEFTADILSNVLDMRKIEFLKRINRIEKKHMLISSHNHTYRFVHEKIREVLYNDIIPELREEYHRMIAETMEDLHREDVEEYAGDIGYHYYMAKDRRAGKYLILAGDKAMKNYANEEAIRFYERATEFIGENERFEIYIKLGDIHAIIGQYEMSFDYYSRSLKSAKNDEERAKVKLKIGNLYEKRGEYDEAMENYYKSLEYLSEDSILRADVYNSMSVAENRRGNYEEAIKYAQMAINISQSERVKERGYHNMGTTYLSMGNYELALKFLSKAIEIGRNIGDLRLLSADYNNIGVVYRKMGRINEALKHYEMSLEVVKKMGDIGEMGTIYNNIGIIHYKGGNPHKALEYFQKSLGIHQRIGDYYGSCLALHNIGGIYVDMGEPEKALEYFQRSLDISTKIGDKWVTAITYSDIGDTYREMGKLNKSLEYIQKSMEIAKEIGSKDALFYNYADLSRIHAYLGNFEKGIEYGEMALSLAREIGSDANIMESYQTMGVVYREMGEYVRSEEYFKRALEISEKMKNNVERALILYELGLLYRIKGEKKWRDVMKKSLSIFENSSNLRYVKKINALLNE